MEAILFLTQEHAKFRRMLLKINDKASRWETKLKVFAELCQNLLTHETIEQKIWYPHLNKDEKLEQIIKHLISEEKDAEKTIKQIVKIKDPDEWQEKFSEFKKSVEHHASEEENKLFPKVKEIFDKIELDKLGKEMREFKREVMNNL